MRAVASGNTHSHLAVWDRKRSGPQPQTSSLSGCRSGCAGSTKGHLTCGGSAGSLSDSLDLPEPHPQGVAEAVLLSPDAVAADPGGVCQAVMGVVSLLSPGGVSRSLLHAAGQAELLRGSEGAAGARLVDEALGRLADGSLLSFSGDASSVRAHRLVMRVVRETAARAGTLENLGEGVCGLLGTLAESLGEPWRNRATARDVIGQVTALHEHLAPSLDDGASLLARGLLWLCGWALYVLIEPGDAPGQAVEYGQALVIDFERVLGTDHPDTLTFQNNLAMAYQAR
jgi:hypothetical protein